MSVHTDPLVEDYLRRLEAAAVVLPAGRRAELVAEIREHIAEALRQAPAGGEAAVRTCSTGSDRLTKSSTPPPTRSRPGSSPPGKN